MYRFILIVFLLGNTSLQGQEINSSDLFKETLVFKVKQLDQFMGRFNNEEDIYGEKFSDDTATSYSRQEMMVALFDLDLVQEESNHQNIREFLEAIESSDTKLSYFDDNWYATLICKAILEGKNRDLALTMSFDGDSIRGSRWVITAAHADFIEKDTITPIIIPPSNHNVDFTDLIRVINEDSENIEDYTSYYTQNKDLQYVISLIEDKKLKLVNTSKSTFHFLQIPGWIFTVDYLNRPSKNSGWLISSLKKVSGQEVKEYKRDRLYLY